MTVAMVALGKIGLPLAVQIAMSGTDVVGIDINDDVVKLVNAGEEPFPGEFQLSEKLRSVVDAGMLRATSDFSEGISDASVVVVVVPVIVDADAKPDFRAIDAATVAIAQNLQPGSLVIYETTLPVHTTRRHFLPLLEQHSGLHGGEDFYLCHSPERVFTGRVFSDLRRYPKLVGGIDAKSAEMAVNFYEDVLEFDERPDLSRSNGVWDLGTAEAAELAKLAETTYRNINIAFANELALHSESIGVDVYQVIESSNSQPYSHIHNPGISVGGHCIPVYPKFYLSVDDAAQIPSAAIRVNESIPLNVVERLSREVGDLVGKRVAILGLAYRGGVKETAFSGAFPLHDALQEKGCQVFTHDPLFTDSELATFGMAPYQLNDPIDIVIIHTDHEEYSHLDSSNFPGLLAIYDGRNILHKPNFKDVLLMTLGLGSEL